MHGGWRRTDRGRSVLSSGEGSGFAGDVMGEIKVQADSVTLDYHVGPARLPVLGGVSLDVYDGEFVAIVGPSGCGKTTFLSVVDGLTAPSGGTVLVNGKSVDGPGKERAVVFQQPRLLPWRNVVRNVQYGLEVQGRLDAAAQKRVGDLVDLVGLSGFERSFPGQLSGGMQQRVNLARALATDPDILLLDEPFASLDAQTREFMQLELLRVWAQMRKTALLITHDIGEAIYLADRVVVFSRRPAVVKDVFDVDFERPRALDVKRQGNFAALEDRVWRALDIVEVRQR